MHWFSRLHLHGDLKVVRSVIGNTLMASLMPGERPYEVRDTRLKGLILRVQPSGVKTFYVEYARGKRVSLGRADAVTPMQARKQAKSILADAYSGKDPSEARRRAKAHTFRSFIEEVYAPWARQNIRTAEQTIRRLRTSFPDLQERKLDEITPWLVEKWRTARLKAGAKPTTVNRDLADLKSSVAKATLWGLLDAHPLDGIKRIKVDTRPNVRFLNEDEDRRLRSALDAREERIRRERASANKWRRERDYLLLPDLRAREFADHLKPMVILSLHTGVRRGELFGLTWGDFDLAGERITIRGASAKSGRTRHIPLNAEALRAISRWQDQAIDLAGLMFPGAGGKKLTNVQKSWKSALKAADINSFRWHDLRHTFASRLVMAGVNLNTVRDLLGHSDYAMTLRYSHLAPEHKAEAVARLVQGLSEPTVPGTPYLEAKR
jgi:integrase